MWGPLMDDLEVKPGLVIPGWELWFTASRASGAGGQHVNRTNSRVTLHWVVTTASTISESDRARLLKKLAPRINDEGVLLISAEEHRSQPRNVEAARERLVALIVAALHRERPRVDTSVPKSQKRRRLADKRVRSEVKAARSKPSGGDPER